jgi:DNA-binding response OmpR family regulator/tetratricopeptide (TPR) repeat protein
VALRILIVEDDKHIRRILETLLTRDSSLAARKPEIVVAEDGKEGLDALAKGPYDLVVSDLLMPRMDGFTFCKELRKHPQGKTVPLIVTSAIYKDPTALIRLQKETGAEFFSKPFQVRELMATVRRLLSQEAAPTAPPPPQAQPASGELTSRSPTRLLLELSEQRATGTLTLRRGKVHKEITLLHGTPVAATSNLRTETLGHFLVARGLLDEQNHRIALERAHSSQDRLGQVLIDLKLITHEALLQQLGAQMRAKITNLLRWSDGTWSFAPGQPVAGLQTPIEAPRLVFTGLQKTAHVDEIARKLAATRGRVALTVRAERHRDAFGRVFGAQCLETLQRRPLLDELLGGGDPSAILVQLDALLSTGMAEIEPSAPPGPAAVEKADPSSLDRIVAQRESPAPAPARSLYDELFSEEEPSQVKPLPEPARGPEPEDEDSGVVALPTGQHAAAAAAMVVEEAPDPKVEQLRTEVLTQYLAIHGKDFYQALGVAHDASPVDIAAAYAELGRRFRLERFAEVDLGRDYARLEEIHQILRNAFETLSSRAERERYDQQLAKRKPPSRASLDADLRAQEAVALLARGDALAARQKLREAVEAAPDQADYHALLGWAVFLAEGGATRGGEGGPPQAQIRRAAVQARSHFDQAFAIDPDSLDGHDYAGRIAAAAGDDANAVGHLERVLDADPTRGDALAALEAAYARRNDWRPLERRYRKLIHRLGDHDPERALRLWWRLAELYRSRLGDRESARIAYEIAAKLAPDDPRPREALARLHAEDPAAWRQTAEALRQSWRLVPHDARPGRSLLELHLEGQRWDAALATAAALTLRNAGDEQAGELLRRYRPRFLQRILQPIDAATIDRVRHPDEDRDLSQLFALVFADWQPPFALGDLGVTDGDALAPDALPETFRAVLAYVAQLYGVAPPRVYRRADFAAQAHVGALREPVLLAGPGALALDDKLALGFQLGRALSFLWPGRAPAGAVPSRELKTLLLATLTLVTPGLKIDDDDGAVARLRAQLAQSPTLARDAAPLVERVLAGSRATLNLSRHVRGLSRSADRLGLLVCDDPITAVRASMEMGVPDAADDLLDFALSTEYLETKAAIGLSIAV